MTSRRATDANFSAAAALRLATHRVAPQFTVADEATVVRRRGQVLVAEYPQAGLVATMQAVECHTTAELAVADNTSSPSFAAYPTLLQRGATLHSHCYQGLSRLRLAALEMVLADARLQSLTSSMYGGAPKLKLLWEPRYAFTEVPDAAPLHLIAHTPEFFVALHRPQFAGVRDKLLTLTTT